MPTNPGGQAYNVLFKSATDQTVGDDDLNYKYDATQPYLAIGEAASANKGQIQLGGATGSGEIKTNQLQLTSAGHIVFQFPTIQVNIDPTGTISTPANVVAFEGSVSAPVNVTAQSSVQLFTGSGNNQPTIAWVDKSRPVNDRVAFSQFNGGRFSFNFSNDTYTNSVTWLSAAGGQAGGVTGINSNSGSGEWVHSGGGLRATGVATNPSPTISLASTNPVLVWYKTNNGTNMKGWGMYLDGSGNLFTGTNTDAGAYTQNAIQITRTGTTVTSHRFFINNAITLGIDNTGMSVTGNVNASANIFGRTHSSGLNPAVIGGPTNTGVVIMEASNYADVAWYDATQTPNARSFDIINFQNAIQFRLKNDAGSATVNPLMFHGGYAGYTGVTASGNWLHNNSSTSTYSNPLVTIQSNGVSTNNPILMFHANNGPDANRKKWYMSGKNGNFFSIGISDDAGTNVFDAYQMYRGNGTVGGHQWYLGNAGNVTSPGQPSMGLANNQFFLAPGVSAVIGNNAVTASAVLDVQSTTAGFLPPRMTTAQMHAIASPANGLIVVNTTINALCVRFGSAWYPITAGAPVPEE